MLDTVEFSPVLRAVITVLAARSIAGHWFGKPRELEVVAYARRHATSGICPPCFTEAEPGREYDA